MENKELILKITNEKIYFNLIDAITIDKTNIPHEHLTFRTNKEIFWKVEMINYQTDSKILLVKVKDYKSNDNKGFFSQLPKRPIEILRFEKFDFQELDSNLTYYQPSKLHEVLYNIEKLPFSKGDNSVPTRKPKKNDEILISSSIQEPADISELTETAIQKHLAEQYEQTEQKRLKRYDRDIFKTFFVKFEDAHFMLGYAAFTSRIQDQDLDQIVDFKIQNDYILAEFDYIKNWFAKILKTKRFKVQAIITILNGQVSGTKATSEDIDKITTELIDSIKYQRIYALGKVTSENNPDKSLFTTDEIFDQLDSGSTKGNIFDHTEQDILNLFINKANVRNKKQLTYLAGKIHSEKHRVLFTLNPDFGYLFFHEGKLSNHFIWELLNSHATYVWSIDKSDGNIELQFKRIENTVNIIRQNKREYYKRAYRNNEIDNDLVFRVIDHEDIESKFVDAFPKWMSKLNEQLV